MYQTNDCIWIIISVVVYVGMPRNTNIIILLCIVIVEHYYCLIAGGFSNVIYFKNISQGLHTFTVVARDKDGLVDRSEVHFEGTCIFEIVSCIIIIGHDCCMHAWPRCVNSFRSNFVLCDVHVIVNLIHLMLYLNRGSGHLVPWFLQPDSGHSPPGV